jgi:hypothetical protein
MLLQPFGSLTATQASIVIEVGGFKSGLDGASM